MCLPSLFFSKIVLTILGLLKFCMNFRISLSTSTEQAGGILIRIEVKWALESITTNKASGGDGIPVELFQILKDDAVKVLHSICQQIWKTQQWPQDWKRPVFIPVPTKDSAKACSNYYTAALISHASKVMLKILQAKQQQYMNQKLPNVQAVSKRQIVKIVFCTI